MKKRLIIGGVALVSLVLIGTLWLLANHATKSSAPAGPSSTPGVSTSGSPEGTESSAEKQNESSITDLEKQPIVRALPKTTPFWHLAFGGSDGATYSVTATVYYKPGEDPAAKIEQQRPFIEQFVRGTGQPDGTYHINYVPQLIDGD